MVRALGAVLMLVTVSTTARAQEPVRSSPAAAPASVSDASAEERAFSAELERFTRLRAFTERLMAKREAEAFEQATLRQARVAKLKRELTEREAAMSQRELDEAVALYLKKRELTRELADAASRAKAAAAAAVSTPSTPSSTTTP